MKEDRIENITYRIMQCLTCRIPTMKSWCRNDPFPAEIAICTIILKNLLLSQAQFCRFTDLDL